ncbi:MAG: DUF6259 domain-containing protein, partial [Lentisphaeria bacterium]|nr:DUF6259 domain-containing protein [Lentisphaeria bacterium]
MRSSLWPLCLLFALAVPAAEWSAGDTRLAVDEATGQLVELCRGDGPNLLAATADAGLWRLVLRRADGTQATLDPAQAESVSVRADGDGLRLAWRGVRAPGQPDALAVIVKVRAGASGKSEWQLDVHGRIAGALWSVEFPRVCGIRSLGASRLAVPLYLGRVVTNPAVNNYSLSLGYPQPASMQAFAYWTLPGDGVPAESPEAETGWLPDESGAEGLYLAAEDGAGHYKQFVVKADRTAGTLSWWVEHIPGLATWPLPADGEPQRVHYETPYPVVLAAYQGDMQEGAALYRDWAKDQVWCQRGKLETWPDKVKPGSEEEARWTPPWFRDLACWLKFYHEPAKILPEFAAYQEWLNVPMASHWYRYNIAKFDDNYNEMLPGDPYLLQGVQDAKSLGVQPLPYINGVIWDTDTQSWHRENGLAAAVKDEAGEFVPWDIHGEIFAYMCPVEQWRAKMRETVRKLVGEHGMSGVYLDCLAATRTMPCYDPSHGHSIRGGNYRARDNRKLMYDLRADARSYAPEACFFTEEIGETFIDGMDGFLTLDYLRSHCRPGERVFPFFSLVYHPYTINFGSDAAIGQDPDSFRLQMGTLYTWGCQPLLSATVAKLPEAGEPTAEFLRELVRHYNDIAKPYLTGGEWVPMSVRTPGSPASQRPIDLLVAEHRVEYAKTGKAKRVWTGPAVLASAWKRGDSLAVTMVNITGQDQTVQVTAPEPLGEVALFSEFSTGQTDPTRPFVLSVVVPAGQPRTFATHGLKPKSRWPDQRKIFQASDGDFPQLFVNHLLAASGVTCQHTAENGLHHVSLLRRQRDGSNLPCQPTVDQKMGPLVEGHGLPRNEAMRSFYVSRTGIDSGSSQVPWPVPGLQIHGADPDFILYSTGADRTAELARYLGGITDWGTIATDLKSGQVVKGFVADWPKELPGGTPFLCASVRGNWEVWTAFGTWEAANSFDPGQRLPTNLRRAVAELIHTMSSDDALASAGKALCEACLESRQNPKPFVAGRPLAQAMERLHALFCARTAMLPLVEIEDDWLSPGFAKTIRLTPAPGYPDRKPDRIEVVPVGDWAKGAVTVTEEVRAEDQATNTHTFTLTLNDGLYVERMVPVLFFL